MKTLAQVQEALLTPFPIEVIELKPGATNRERTQAMAMAYADSRVYQERLDEVVGPEGWQSDYVITDRGILCRLTILGVTKCDVGDYKEDEGKNILTTAAAQAFKRACSAFGLGRYLYSLPTPWVEFDAQRKRITASIPPIVTRLYQEAGVSGRKTRLPVTQRL